MRKVAIGVIALLALLVVVLAPNDASAAPLGVGPTSIEVSKTADFDGRFVSGTISITNVGENPAIISAMADSLEVHFPRKVTPPPLPAGSTPNWFKVADVPVAGPGPIPVGETVNIDYTFDVCDAADFSGANSMRNVVAVTLDNKPEKAQTDTVVTRSDSFKPGEPKCPGVEVDFLACRPTDDPFNAGFPDCDLQTGVATNDLVSAPPTGTLAVLEPDTVQHTATWESAPTTAPITLLPGQVTLDLVLMNMGENLGSDDICWSKHIILPDSTEITVVKPHCFENPLPALGFGVCPFGAQPPPAACIAVADFVSETVTSEILVPTVIPAGSVKEISVFCPGASFLGVFFNDGLDVDGDGVDEFSKITEPILDP